MSISNNTTKLQSLMDKINALPDAENLNEEISTQETLISEQDTKLAELAEILDSKASGGGSGTNTIETCTVTIEYDIQVDDPKSAVHVNTINNDGIIQYTTLQSGEDFIFSPGMWGSHSATITIDNVVKNSILLVVDSFSSSTSTDGVDFIFDHHSKPTYRAFNITQNGSIIIY